MIVTLALGLVWLAGVLAFGLMASRLLGAMSPQSDDSWRQELLRKDIERGHRENAKKAAKEKLRAEKAASRS